MNGLCQLAGVDASIWNRNTKNKWKSSFLMKKDISVRICKELPQEVWQLYLRGKFN